MALYSHSKISTFEQCPLKFKFKYIEKLKPEIKQTIEGFLGNKVHETLEWIYSQVPANIPQLDSIVEFFLNKWQKEFTSEIKIIKTEFDSEYYLNQGIKFLINYFDSHYPFDENTIATEKKVLIELEGEHKIQGYIDRIVYNSKNKVYEVHDYKTGAPKTQEELDKDRQLAIYSMGLENLYGNLSEVHLFWHFLAFNKKMKSIRTHAQLEALKKEIQDLINQIESEKEFPPNPGILCNWCEFRKHCEDYRKNKF
jgi:putative RecB family exonuclease